MLYWVVCAPVKVFYLSRQLNPQTRSHAVNAEHRNGNEKNDYF